MDIVTVVMIIQYIGIAILFFEFIYALIQKPSELQKSVLMLTVACILMIAGYIIEMQAKCLETAMIGVGVSYLGKPFVMISSLMFITSCYGRSKSNKFVVGLLLWGALFPILVFSNDYHHLYYATVSFDIERRYSPLMLTHGPLYYTYVISSVLFFITCVYTIVKGYKRSGGKGDKRMAVYSVLMTLSGMIGYAVYLSGLSNGYDATMMGIFIGVIFLFLIFFKCRVFDVVSLAKDYALDNSEDGLIIYNDSDEIVFMNNIASELIKGAVTLEYLCDISEGETIYEHDDRILSVFRKSLTNGQLYIGKSIMIRDITGSFNYQKRLEKAVHDTTERLDTIRRKIFASIASIVEARSLETGDHIRRVSEYTERIARALQKKGDYADILTDEYINMLTLSAPLHDLGKISVSDTILLKPGKLTREEFETMKKHSVLGAEIIQSTMNGLEDEKYIELAREIALYHHEKWNGTGYPKGLMGEDIPLSARIVALADCYDALTTKRCYKDAYSDEEAVGIIKEENGTHFDPTVVSAFLEDRENRKQNRN